MPHIKDSVVNWSAASSVVERSNVLDTLGWLSFQKPQLMAVGHGLKLYLINDLSMFVTDGHFGVILLDEPADTEDAFNQFKAAKKANALE